jgi:hypothetical protein
LDESVSNFEALVPHTPYGPCQRLRSKKKRRGASTVRAATAFHASSSLELGTGKYDQDPIISVTEHTKPICCE